MLKKNCLIFSLEKLLYSNSLPLPDNLAIELQIEELQGKGI